MEDNVAGLRCVPIAGSENQQSDSQGFLLRSVVPESGCTSLFAIHLSLFPSPMSPIPIITLKALTISSRITSDLRVTSSTSSIVIQTFASRAVVLGS
jgi:hypothetical protein